MKKRLLLGVATAFTTATLSMPGIAMAAVHHDYPAPKPEVQVLPAAPGLPITGQDGDRLGHELWTGTAAVALGSVLVGLALVWRRRARASSR